MKLAIDQEVSKCAFCSRGKGLPQAPAEEPGRPYVCDSCARLAEVVAENHEAIAKILRARTQGGGLHWEHVQGEATRLAREHGKVVCPDCGHTGEPGTGVPHRPDAAPGFQYLEMVWVERDVVDPKLTDAVYASGPCKVLWSAPRGSFLADIAAESGRLTCRYCLSEFPLPREVMVEFGGHEAPTGGNQ